MDYFKMNSHASFAYKLWFFIERPPKLHINYFEMTQDVGIAFRVGSTP